MIPTASHEAERDFRERGFTEREADAARSALAGMTAAAAAREMGISASTVGSLRQRAYQKLGVSGAAELVRKYAEKSADKNAGEKDWRPTLHSHGLSETQASVLSLACSGRSTAQIADELHLAEGTVRAARATGYRMLGVHSREELAALLEREAAAPRRRRAARLAAACLAAAMVVAVAIIVIQKANATSQWQERYPYLDSDFQFHAEMVPFTATDDESGAELFGVNESGQRFGRYEYVTAYLGGTADLYAAMGSDGTPGYVRADEGLTGMDALLAKDGETIIGEGALRTDRISRIGEYYPDPEAAPFTARTPEGEVLFGVNASGQRYGSRDFADLYLQGQLDLVAASGEEGQRGYVPASALEAPGAEGEIPLFASDGTTQVGWFALVSDEPPMEETVRIAP